VEYNALRHATNACEVMDLVVGGTERLSMLRATTSMRHLPPQNYSYLRPHATHEYTRA